MTESTQDTRPAIGTVRSGDELRRWYWTKAELVAFARISGLPASGNKPALTDRIATWLDTGTIARVEARKATSRFDWKTETLTPDTVITDSYRNTSNVREFMKTHAHPRFAFSNEFMAWMRANAGKTLADAVTYWRELDRKKREDGYREASLPQNHFVRFSKAVAKAKPGLSAADIRRLWKRKRSGPGPHEYMPGDEDG